MTRPGPTPVRPCRAARARRGLLAALVGFLLVLAGIVVGAVPAAAQNAVGVSTTAAANTVGVSADISAGQRLGNGLPQPQIVVATAVAAEAESSVATPARSCLNSFTGVTPVTMADGSRKPISKVKVGDKVLATDPETGETKAEPVVQLIRHSGEHGMVLVRLADGSVLDSTNGHSIWDATAGQFTEASKLRIGDTIETTKGAQLTIAGLTTYDADLTAYNLQIDEIHTYYAGATPVLVHNSCGYTPAGGFAGSDIEEVGQSVYQHIGAGDIPGRPGLTQIMDALTRGTPQSLKQGDGSIAQVIDHEGVRVIINEDSPWRSTAFFPGQ